MPVPSFAALIDAPTGALLTLSLHVPIIAFLAKSETDVHPLWGVNFPNYARSFPLAWADPATFPSSTWVGPKRLFEPTPLSLISDRVRAASATAVKKSYALYEMMTRISMARHLLSTGIILQETVYLTKRAQALRYQTDGYPEGDLLRYPYVLQAAEVMGVTPRVAADEILFKAQLDDEILAKTEAVRLKYFSALKTAKLNEIDELITNFRSEIA